MARIVIYSRRKLQTIITILVSDKNGKTVFQSESKITLEAGLIELKEKLPAPVGTGAYSLCVRFQEGLKCELNFYKLGSDELSRFEESLQKLEIIVHDPLELSSYYGLKYKFRELVNQIDSFEPGEPPKVIEEAIDNFKQLLERCKIHHHLYTEEGYIRTAFLSRVDRSLQPYSIYLPENFDRELRYKLIVALHGSGVDEVAFLKSTGAKLAGSKYIVVAPRGRELSDWYIGQTETDILDMITVLKGMFHIEETLAYGFSMGGFGVWRLIFRAPILFAGAMIISGAIRNPSDESSLHDELWSQPSIKEIPVLVMHGAEDRAVPVCDVKDFVQGLQRQGFNICFKEVDGAGHGNYGYAGVIESWLIRHGL